MSPHLDERDRLEREIVEMQKEFSRIDDDGNLVHDRAEKEEIAKRLARLEALVEEWR